MTDISRALLVRCGLHASVNDITAEAGTLIFIEPVADVDLKANQAKLERNFVRASNEELSAVLGVKSASMPFTLHVRGVNGGAGDNVSAARLTKTELGTLLDSIFGAGTDGTGATITDGDGSVPDLDVDDTAGFSVGTAVLFSNGTEIVVREVTARSTSSGAGTLTLDRDYSGTPSGVAYGSASWAAAPSSQSHKHLYFDVEGQNWRRKLFGAMSNLTIAFPMGQQVTASFDPRFCDWSDAAEANPSFTAPTVGNDIIATNGELFIGDTPYAIADLAFDLGLEIQERTDLSAANGVGGYVVVRVKPKLTAKLYKGELTTDATDTILGTLQSAGTLDVAVQFGRAAGAAMYLRMSAADPRDAVQSITNGLETIDVVFHGTGATPVRLHLL